MTPLTAFRLEWHEADDTHDELTITMTTIDDVTDHPDRYPHVTDLQLADAAEYGAGILARIAFQAANEIRLEAAEHHCGGHRSPVFRSESGHVLVDGCNVAGPDSMLTPRASYAPDAPAVWIVVPHGHITAWRERVNGWLQAITDDRQSNVTQLHPRSTA